MKAVFDIAGLTGGHVLPPLPFPYTGSGDVISQTDSSFPDAEAIAEDDAAEIAYTAAGTPMCVPVWLKATNGSADWWLLPMEPLIHLSGGNTLPRRSVAKSTLRGTIKERWNTDDYAINIEGIITRHDDLRFPAEDVSILRALLEGRDTLDIKCALLNDVYGIRRMAVEKYDFPFTKGPENQAYRISGYSDDDWTLFIDPLTS